MHFQATGEQRAALALLLLHILSTSKSCLPEKRGASQTSNLLREAIAIRNGGNYDTIIPYTYSAVIYILQQGTKSNLTYAGYFHSFKPCFVWSKLSRLQTLHCCVCTVYSPFVNHLKG